MRPYRSRRKHTRPVEQKEYPFYPNFLFRVLIVFLAALALTSLLSALFPLPLDPIADPLAQPAPGTRALWILKPAIMVNSVLPMPGLTIVLIVFLAALFVLLPLLDRSGHSSMKRRALVAVPFLLWMLFLAVSLLSSTGVRG